MKRAAVLFAHSVAGWAVCGGVIGLGRRFLPMGAVLAVHAVVAPAAFAVLAWRYFRRFPDASPLNTAVAMTVAVIALDLLIVAPFAERSFDMFRSVPGTWIPFASILAAIYIVGRLARGARR